jgi:hypothetical protein
MAGTYTLSVKLEGEKINGSDWTMVALPGEISPSACLHSISTTPIQMTAGITLFFEITMKDIYGNLIREDRNNIAIGITGAYANH